MDNTKKLQNILATFLGIAPDDVVASTVIDRRAIPGSVIFLRLYAALAKEGFEVRDPGSIHTFRELIDNLGLNEGELSSTAPEPQAQSVKKIASSLFAQALGVGVDIEATSNMPEVDFWEDEFYKRNFTNREISFCILQPSPRQSFSGLFAAKEAISKADNSYLGKPFNQIEIMHGKNGAPLFDGFTLSISHTEDLAVAVAATRTNSQIDPSLTDLPPLKIPNENVESINHPAPISTPATPQKNPLRTIFPIFTFVLSCLALFGVILLWSRFPG